MDRLTEYRGGTPFIQRLSGYSNYMRDSYDIEAVRRLAAYEDTGLTPEEVLRLKGECFGWKCDAEKYKDAESDGRLIVLPCKVGDKVRDLFGNYVFTIEKIVVLDNTLIFKCGNPGTQDYMSFDKQDIGERVEILHGKEDTE